MESSRHTSFEFEAVVGFLQGGSSHLHRMVDRLRMDDKSVSVWEYIPQAHVHVALDLVRDIAMTKAASLESHLKQTRALEIRLAGLLEADGHQILCVRFEHDLFGQIHS